MYCKCRAALASKGNIPKTLNKTYFTTWRPRLHSTVQAGEGQTRSGPNRIAAAIGGVIFQDLWLKFNLCLEDYEQLTNEQQEEEIVPLIDLLGIGAGKNPKILRMSNKTTFLEQWAGLFRRWRSRRRVRPRWSWAPRMPASRWRRWARWSRRWSSWTSCSLSGTSGPLRTRTTSPCSEAGWFRLLTGCSKWIQHRILKYSICYLRDVTTKIERDPSKSI